VTRERVVQLALLAAVVALAAFLRFDGLGRPSYWLDEILGDQLTTRAASEPLWRWITGLERQHGPLYYATQLATRVAGRDEAAGRLAAALFGLATIPLVWLAAVRAPSGSVPPLPAGEGGPTDDAKRRREGRVRGEPYEPPAKPASWPALICAFLMAISPLHVYYSREARPYALVVLLTATLMVVLLRRGSIVAACLVLLALLYTSAVAAPVVAAAAVTAAIAAVLAREEEQRRRLLTITAIAAATTLLFAALYRGAPPTTEATGFPASAITVLAQICRALSVSALGAQEHGRTAAVMVALAVAGVLAIARRDRHAAVIVAGMTVFPALFATASLRVLGHWFAVRYVAPALVGFIVLAGCGVTAIGELAAAPLRRWKVTRIASTAIALAVTVAIATQTWAAARREPLQKLDWRAIAAALERHARPGDVIAAADGWSDVSLRYYLRSLAPGVRVANIAGAQMAEIITATRPSVWFVSDGTADATEVRGWSCTLPMVLSTRLEGVRINYAPSARQFVRTRSTPEDLRAMAASLGPQGFTIHSGVDDDAFLGSGWGGAEGSGGNLFRWIVDREASLSIPRYGRRDRIVRVHAMPVVHPALPPQRMVVTLNGAMIADALMPDQWREYAFDAPAVAWLDGLNTLSFRFARVTAPAALDPSSSDHRTLAASFDRISIQDRGASLPVGIDPHLVITVGFASDDLLEAKGVQRSRATRLPAGQLNRDAVEALLGRLGFDPVTTWPIVARDEIHLEDLAVAIAYGSDCEDDRTFLQRAFAVMVQRHPNFYEQRDLLARLKAGSTRVHIVERITRADDFRARMLRR
jgi:mannosyltransferase